ncbi:MAG TPA: divergent PAP2 family protein [Candidatus Dormibacteraeota bacterium]|nr:divergent PAP2 family protein [Candidatus Dormibacteraeota bacterium]
MRYILPAVLAWAIAQTLKVVLRSFEQRRLNLRTLADTGGMPSSHSALVMALTTSVGRLDGLASSTFAVALIFSFVVMYDAQGVRRAAGRQAEVLNRLIEDVFGHRGVSEGHLRELLGHTPIEVLVGAVLGIGVGLLPI